MDSVALFAWLPLCAVVFAIKKPHEAALWLMLAGALYLPERAVIQVPVFPDLDKDVLPPLGILLFGLLFGKGLLSKGKMDGLSKALVVALMFTDVARTFLNPDPIIAGGVFAARGLDRRTAITFILTDLISYVVPFILGAALAHRRDWFIATTKTWFRFAMVYGLLILLEARLSPQVHRWVYGYLQHSFSQLMRGGGFRPIVFMNHALEVALYCSSSALLAIMLYKRKVKVVNAMGLVIVYLTILTFVCKSSASIIYLMIGGAAYFFLSPRLQTLLAAFLATLVIATPLVHLSDNFPSQEIVEYAARMTDADRAQSLEFRFGNDDSLVRQTQQRPYFGWGGYSRGWVYNDDGSTWTVVDGAWIIALNDRGIIGYMVHFGLFLWPIFKALRYMKPRYSKEARGLIAGLSLLLGFCSFDLLMNGMFNAFPFFFAGLLMGLMNSSWIRANPSMPPGLRGVMLKPPNPGRDLVQAIPR